MADGKDLARTFNTGQSSRVDIHQEAEKKARQKV